MRVVTVEQMKALEAEGVQKGVSIEKMMLHAGFGIATAIMEDFGGLDSRVALGLVGPGNNGGDTLIALASLSKAGWKALAYITKDRPADDPVLELVHKSDVEVAWRSEDRNLQKLSHWCKHAGLILDGILGTGVHLPLQKDLADLLGRIKSWRPPASVVAVDCPSGVDSGSGEAATETLPARITYCLEAVKTGLLKLPAFQYMGTIRDVPLNLPASLKTYGKIETFTASRNEIRSWMPERAADAHKGSFGKLMIIAGSTNYTGAAYLAGRGAYRVGTGWVRMAVPTPLHRVLAGVLPEATWLLLPDELGAISDEGVRLAQENLAGMDALLLGPGLGQEETTFEFVRDLLTGKRGQNVGEMGFRAGGKNHTQAGRLELPRMVIDADGLRLMARIPGWAELLPAGSVLTPHPGEMAALTGLSVDEIQSDRLEITRSFARQWKQIVILKGALSVIANPQGQAYINPFANSALAKAGTGDVLAGVVAGLIAQGMDPFRAAVAGCDIHARAAVLLAESMGTEASVLAGEIADAIPLALKDLVR